MLYSGTGPDDLRNIKSPRGDDESKSVLECLLRALDAFLFPFCRISKYLMSILGATCAAEFEVKVNGARTKGYQKLGNVADRLIL